MSVVEFSADAWQAASPGLQAGLARRVERVSELVQGLEQLAGSGDISGAGADAMRAYIREVHLPVLRSLLVGLSTFQTAVGVYWDGYGQVDAGGNFRLVRDEHAAHLTQLATGMEQLRGFSAELRGIAANASHLVSLGGAGAVQVEATVTGLEAMHRIVQGQADTWEAYEASDPGFGQVRELIGELSSILRNVGGLTVGRGRSYRAGSFTLTLQRLGELTAGMFEYCQKNQQSATAGWERMFSEYAEDVEAARREQAGWDLIWDGLQIAAGVLVTVIGLGLTPFTGGFSLGLTVLGGALVVGGVNSAINHASIATTGNELNLVGMAAETALQWYDVNVATPAAGSGSWGAQFLAGVGSGALQAVSGAAQLNVKEIHDTVHTLATDQAARHQLWNQITTTAGKILSGDAYTTGEVASVLLPGAAALKGTRTGSHLGTASTLATPSKPVMVTTPHNTTSALDWIKTHTGAGTPTISKEFTPTVKALHKSDSPASASETPTPKLSLRDFQSIRGATPDEIRALIPRSWIEKPLRKGDGVRFLNPRRPGESISIENGWPGHEDPLHSGPYVKISRDGTVERIPLQGNPVLGDKQ